MIGVANWSDCRFTAYLSPMHSIQTRIYCALLPLYLLTKAIFGLGTVKEIYTVVRCTNSHLGMEEKHDFRA